MTFKKNRLNIIRYLRKRKTLATTKEVAKKIDVTSGYALKELKNLETKKGILLRDKKGRSYAWRIKPEYRNNFTRYEILYFANLNTKESLLKEEMNIKSLFRTHEKEKEIKKYFRELKSLKNDSYLHDSHQIKREIRNLIWDLFHERFD